MKYTDPTGHFWGIGGSVKRQWNRSRHHIVGAISAIVGAVLLFTPFAPIGVALMTGGMSMMSYDPNQPTSMSNQISFSTSYSYNTSWGQGGGLTAGQQYSVGQGSKDTAQLQPYLDTLGVRYVYGNSSGDIAVYPNGIQYNSLSSFNTIREREYQLEVALNLIVSATDVSQGVKNMFRTYMEDYYIIYTDTPFLELTPGDNINTYNGVHHGDDFSGRTRNYRRNDGVKISYTVQGRGIEYSSLIWTHGGGYLSQNFMEVLFHEISHNRSLYGTGHSRIKNGMNIRENATQEANLFFQSYPDLERYR